MRKPVKSSKDMSMQDFCRPPVKQYGIWDLGVENFFEIATNTDDKIFRPPWVKDIVKYGEKRRQSCKISLSQTAEKSSQYGAKREREKRRSTLSADFK